MHENEPFIDDAYSHISSRSFDVVFELSKEEDGR